jgi:predicted adenylyl cyclase CyaB
MQEIECKIPLSAEQKDTVRTAVQELFSSQEPTAVYKDDRYYTDTTGETAFRVRCSEHQLEVTRKQKQRTPDGFEMNREIAFSTAVDEASHIYEFFQSLGYVELARKQKEGVSWHRNTLTIELVHVQHLGWFLEMEHLLGESASSTEIDAALADLNHLRKALHLDAIPVEGRYYLDMLQEATH